MSVANEGDLTLAVFCLVLGSFQLVEILLPSGVISGLYATFQQVWVLWARPISDLGIWLGLELWGFGNAPGAVFYAASLTGLSVAAYRGISERVLTAAVAFFAINLVIYWMLVVFWVDYGGVFEFLIADTLYSLLMLTGVGLFIAKSPSHVSLGSVLRRPTMDPAGRGAESASTQTGARPDRRTDAAGTGQASDASVTVSGNHGSGELSPESGEPTRASTSSDGETDTGEHRSTKTGATPPATSGDGTRTTRSVEPTEGNSDGGPAHSDGDGKAKTSRETILSELDEQAVTPEKITELGETLAGGELPDDAATVLERYADADDADVRLAVCRVCAKLEDERASDLLRRLRIDPDDRVAAAAVDGLE